MRNGQLREGAWLRLAFDLAFHLSCNVLAKMKMLTKSLSQQTAADRERQTVALVYIELNECGDKLSWVNNN